MAFEPLRRLDREIGEGGRHVLLSDSTLEALARELSELDGSAALDCDELAVLLRGLGEYKRGAGSDRGRFLQIWSGEPWRLHRVGQSKTAQNKVRLRIDEPTLPICGTLQTRLHGLLGSEEDGLRPRFLPFLAELPETGGSGLVETGEWALLLQMLADPARRERERTWILSREARECFRSHRMRWKAAARGAEALDVSAASIKGDVHLLRVALVFAEAEEPAADGGVVDASVIERAARIIDFTIDSWRALPVLESLALSRRDERLDGGVSRLIDWLERRPERRATRREIRRARVGGARTEGEINALLERYESIFPGSITVETGSHGGSPWVLVRAPRRGVVFPSGTAGATGKGGDENPRKSESFEPRNAGATGNGATENGVGGRPSPPDPSSSEEGRGATESPPEPSVEDPEGVPSDDAATVQTAPPAPRTGR